MQMRILLNSFEFRNWNQNKSRQTFRNLVKFISYLQRHNQYAHKTVYRLKYVWFTLYMFQRFTT